jgi:hypothetical protein
LDVVKVTLIVPQVVKNDLNPNGSESCVFSGSGRGWKAHAYRQQLYGDQTRA